MKRWLARITICLFLGVVTTVAVAWVLAWNLRWDDFLIDTGVFSIIWFALMFVPGATRRTIRRRRRRCPKCGYDLRGDLDAGCPECGWNREEEGIEGPRQQGIEDESQ